MSFKKPGPRRPEPRPAAMAAGSGPTIPISRAAGEACARVDRVAEYLDGTLDPAAQDELLAHLPTCESCQRVLHGEVQLRDREDSLREVAAVGAARSAGASADASAGASAGASDRLAGAPALAVAPKVEPAVASTETPARTASDQAGTIASLDAARRARAARLRKLAGVAASVLAVGAVAATALFVLRTRPAPTGSSEPSEQLALAPKRAHEVRLAWSRAAAHRPFETMRSSAAVTGEDIPLELRARLERDKDCAGLAATSLMAGETASAQRQYAKPECQSLDARADHAALAVVMKQYDLGLELTDAVLAERPDHPVALWNRALALREKKLGLDAAAAFDRVAATDRDPAWRAEAQARAEDARAPLEAARRRFDEVIERGKQMIPDGPVIPLELARAVPGRARLRFHDAVRTARTAERLEALRPLAQALQLPGERSLEAAIDATKKILAGPGAAARLALIPHYVEIFRKGSVEGDAEWPAWKARARAAAAADLLLGAYYLALPDDPEAARLAAASKDPWFIGLSESDRFDALALSNDLAKAERALRALEAQCKVSSLPFLCLKAAMARAELSLDNTLAAPTVTAALQAFEMATAQGESLLRTSAAYFVAEGERLRSAYSLARAYYEESGERARLTGDCNDQQDAIAALAAMEFDRHRFTEVRRLLKTLPSCDSPPPRTLLDVQADLLTAGIEIDEPAWRKGVQNLSTPDNVESDQLCYGYLLARQELRSDPAARARLQALIERASSSHATSASRVVAAAEATLVVAAGRDGHWKEMMNLAAVAHHVPTPQRCALAHAKDNFQVAIAVISSSGEFGGTYHADVGADYRWQLPTALRDALAPCDEVSVLAFPPWPRGEPPLPPSLPWHFVMSESRTALPETVLSDVPVIVANSQPPAEQQLATLAPLREQPASTLVLSGPSATISRVAAEAPRAGLLEFHVHTSRVAASDAPVLALSESPSGWALTAEEVSGWNLAKHPVVLLADCSGAVPAAYDHVAWGLPAAFLRAGARAVVAPLVDIPDGEGGEFFARIREELRVEPDVAKVVARLRAEKIASDPASWVRNVVVFQ